MILGWKTCLTQVHHTMTLINRPHHWRLSFNIKAAQKKFGTDHLRFSVYLRKLQDMICKLVPSVNAEVVTITTKEKRNHLFNITPVPSIWQSRHSNIISAY